MGIIRKGILGGFSGKVGNLVGSERMGKDTIANYREGDTINWSLQTDAERTRMSYLSQFLNACPDDMVTTFWPIRKKYCNSYFTAISDNYGHTSDVTGFTPTSTMVKRYKMMHNPLDIVPVWRSSGSGSITWSGSQFGGNQKATDLVTVVYWVPSQNRVIYQKDRFVRSVGFNSTTIVPMPIGTVYWCFVFFRSVDGKLTSNPSVAQRTVTSG